MVAKQFDLPSLGSKRSECVPYPGRSSWRLSPQYRTRGACLRTEPWLLGSFSFLPRLRLGCRVSFTVLIIVHVASLTASARTWIPLLQADQTTRSLYEHRRVLADRHGESLHGSIDVLCPEVVVTLDEGLVDLLDPHRISIAPQFEYPLDGARQRLA